MRILMTGAGGMIGSALRAVLAREGHEIVPLSRFGGGAGRAAVGWDPAAGRLDPGALEGFDAVVHLAGETVAGRWTPARKAAIRESRVGGTRLLSSALAGLDRRPSVLVSASASGYYGDRGDEVLDEDAPPGRGFLASVVPAWESATEPAREAGIRVVLLRQPIVLSPSEGALARLLPPFRLGLGGRFGSGRQWWSWISLDDLVGVYREALLGRDLVGPVNASSPGPVTNREFARALGRILRRPAILPLPGFALRLLLREAADEMLLASARLEPLRLRQAGFRFRHPRLPDALREMLGRASA